LAGAGVIAFTKIAMKLLTADEYYSSWKYVPILSAAMIFTAFVSFTGTVYTVNKKSVLSFLTAFAGAGTNIVLNFILIPTSLGVYGAAIATVASYLLVFVIRCFNVKKYIPFNLYPYHIIANSIIILIQSLAIIFEVKYWMIIEAVCLIAILLINKNFILRFINKILSSLFRRKRNV